MDIENMRPATKEEMDAINKYIASISIDAGFSIWDLQEQVKVYDAYRNKGYVEGYNQVLEDFERKMSSFCFGLKASEGNLCRVDVIEDELQRVKRQLKK